MRGCQVSYLHLSHIIHVASWFEFLVNCDSCEIVVWDSAKIMPSNIKVRWLDSLTCPFCHAKLISQVPEYCLGLAHVNMNRVTCWGLANGTKHFANISTFGLMMKRGPLIKHMKLIRLRKLLRGTPKARMIEPQQTQPMSLVRCMTNHWRVVTSMHGSSMVLRLVNAIVGQMLHWSQGKILSSQIWSMLEPRLWWDVNLSSPGKTQTKYQFDRIWGNTCCLISQ